MSTFRTQHAPSCKPTKSTWGFKERLYGSFAEKPVLFAIQH
jgi:hypothetical protein